MIAMRFAERPEALTAELTESTEEGESEPGCEILPMIGRASR